MLYTSFKNYEEFKQLFPIRVYDGRQCRSNKILLSLYKSGRWFFHSPLRGITNMAELEDKCLELVANSECAGNGEQYEVSLMGRAFRSTSMYTDDRLGVCEDGDTEQIRVHFNGDGRFKLLKRKAGKVIRAIITENSIGRNYPAEVVNYLCEQFTTKWKAYAISHNPDYELHVDDHFSSIYNGNRLDGDFGSCMTNRGHHSFYSNALDGARAAYITSRNSGKIMARAVIYNALDEDGCQWRLCERQYAPVGSRNEILKQTLVNMLIVNGHIDGYKAIGASCHDSTNFVDNDGRSISHHTFRCRCNLPQNNVVSYQDSFKWYYPTEGLVYNKEVRSSGYVNLATTSQSVTIRQNYDQYHQHYTNSRLVNCWHDGSLVNCSVNELEDFIQIDGRYFHRSHVQLCRISGMYFQTMSSQLSRYGSYSSILGEWFYNSSARNRAEVEYMEQNYVECADDVQRHDPEECFYSELLDRYFWFEQNLEREEEAVRSISNAA